MEFLGDTNTGSAVDVVQFVRQVVEVYTDLRQSITRKLLDSLGQVKSSKVYRGALWIIGEYTQSSEDIDNVFSTLREALGDLPLFSEDEEEEQKVEEKKEVKTTTSTGTTRPKVLADGTYATQSAVTETATVKANIPQLRALMLGGDFFLGSVYCATLTKLALKALDQNLEQATKNLLISQVLLIMTSIVRLGQSKVPLNPIDSDSYERIVLCIRVLTELDPVLREILIEECHKSFSRLLHEQEKNKPKKQTTQTIKKVTNISFERGGRQPKKTTSEANTTASTQPHSHPRRACDRARSNGKTQPHTHS